MGRKKIQRNTLNFKSNFFLFLAQYPFTPCEYKCLLVLAEGTEKTKTNIADILNDSKQHIGKAMLHLERIGVIVCTRIEGRNAFFGINLDWMPSSDDDKN